MKRALVDRLADLQRSLQNLKQRLSLDIEEQGDALEMWTARVLDLDPTDPKEQAIIRRSSKFFASEGYDDMIGEATIKCFEICYDLFWKSIRQFLLEIESELTDDVPASPNKVFKRAYELGMVNAQQERVLIDMHNDRGDTAHTYIENTTHQIVSHMPPYHQLMQQLYEQMNERSKRQMRDDFT